MELKLGIVIDSNGFKVEYVAVDAENNSLDYVMQEGESLVFEDIATALSMTRPQWSSKKWVEKATEEEIEASRPKIKEIQKNQHFQAFNVAENDSITSTMQRLEERLIKIEETLSIR